MNLYELISGNSRNVELKSHDREDCTSMNITALGENEQGFI